MGYEIHISRNKSSKQLTLEEWTKYIKADQSISADHDKQGIYHWTDHPQGGIKGEHPWMRFSNGQVSTRNPDEFLTLKMFQIAQ